VAGNLDGKACPLGAPDAGSGQVPRAVIPDMLDRMIAATVVHLDVPVLRHNRRSLSNVRYTCDLPVAQTLRYGALLVHELEPQQPIFGLTRL